MSVKTVIQPAQELARPYGGRASLLVHLAASFSLVAALIHLWVAPVYFFDWWAYSAFFLCCALAQGLGSILILRFPTSTPISLSGIAGSLLVALLYVISRMWGIPIGPTWVPFDPSVAHLEDAEVLGMVATAAEVGVAFCGVALLEGSLQRVVVNILLVVGALMWLLRITGILP